MTLMGIIGDLGSGKTLSSVYFGYRAYLKKRAIFTNMESLIYKNKMILTILDLEEMRSGFANLDELWLWADSRLSISLKNRVSSLILLKSRKRDMDIVYTTQHWMQIDCRIRNVTDFIIMPELSQNETFCRIKIMSYPYLSHVKTITFRTTPFFSMYDHTEEIEPLICTPEMIKELHRREQARIEEKQIVT
jgi:hypothetical protein